MSTFSLADNLEVVESRMAKRALRHRSAQARAKVIHDRVRMNQFLSNLGATYWNELPLKQIDAALAANGFNILEPGFYCGADGRINEAVGIGLMGREKIFLSLSWHKMQSGRYEIVAYLS